MTLSVTLVETFPKSTALLLHKIRSSSLQGITALPHFTQHLFMPLEFLKRAGFDGNALLQQIQDHFADGVDLVAVGVGQ